MTDSRIPYELTVPRYDYEILLEPVGRVATVWRHAIPHKPGARLATEWSVPSRPWPTGGVFVPKGATSERVKPTSWYRPSDDAGEILLDVQRTDASDSRALLQFVTRWGVLGVGIEEDVTASFDGVQLTGEWIARLQRWIEAHHQLRRGTATVATWANLADALTAHVSYAPLGARPAPRAAPKRLEAVIRPARLLDALWLEVWSQATGARRLRRCPECQALFPEGRRNKRFCSHLCANRPTVRRAKRKQRLAARRARRAARPTPGPATRSERTTTKRRRG